MPKISILPDHVASQIAAGEVVERPSSVVKELVENSIDSHATTIVIDIGRDVRDIRIADDGCGMSPDDAALAFQRHATSKLASVADLESLSTLGFRGEALPSIASISKFSCLTRAKDAPTGSRVESKDGRVTVTETGCGEGTVMEVRDLFHNVPARLKFLKKPVTEFGHIQEIVQSLAISYPEISFELKFDKVTRFKTTGSGDLESTISEAKLFSGNESLLKIEISENNLVITGYIARPTHFRGDRKAVLAIVNGRPVRCPLTYRALDYAYSDLIPRGRYPLAVIKIEIDPGHIDVNIHPSKKEIKYDNGNEIYTLLHRAISESLKQPRKELAESIRASREALTKEFEAETAYNTIHDTVSQDSTRPASVTVQERPEDYAPDSKRTSDQLSFRDSLSYLPAEKQPLTSISLSETTGLSGLHADSNRQLPAGWRLAGYLHNTYFIFETPDAIEIIEQHIAHERYLYEKILASQTIRGRTSVESQRLCISSALTLTTSQVESVKSNLPQLQSLGFDFEFDQKNLSCSCIQVPLEMAHQNYAVIIQKMIEDIQDSQTATVSLDATKSIACQSAIKNGMTLCQNDILKLVSAWLATPRNDTCPHGRPVRLQFSREKLFDLFHPA